MIVPTVARLKALKPGESCVYYRGSLPGDIGRSANTPQYAKVLQAVCDTVAELERASKIEVCVRDLTIPLKAPRQKGCGFRPGSRVLRNKNHLNELQGRGTDAAHTQEGKMNTDDDIILREAIEARLRQQFLDTLDEHIGELIEAACKRVDKESDRIGGGLRNAFEEALDEEIEGEMENPRDGWEQEVCDAAADILWQEFEGGLDDAIDAELEEILNEAAA